MARKSRKSLLKDIELSVSEERVFSFMLDFGGITTLDAFVELGDTRLSARIFTLKEKGIPIGSDRIKVKNRYGESRSVKRYYIA